ncbi:MAG: hypothetical protein WB973_13940 [Thermoanaerobaculia bacterium]
MSDEHESPSVPKRLTELAAIAAFYLYFAGWVYVSELFGRMGLTSYVLDLPLYSVFVYAYRVFFDSVWCILLLLLVAALWYVATGIVKPNRLVIVTFVVLLAPFPLIRRLAVRSAQATESKIRSGAALPVVAHPRPGLTTPDDPLLKQLASEKLYLIAETKDRFYVFYQPPPEQGQLGRGRAYVLPADSFILEVTIQNTVEASR